MSESANTSLSFYKASLLPARCAVDLSDGSERGEYVCQDYILNRLGRPHRAINLMYCYYPHDVGWPGRASVVHAHDDACYAWDYPYDDYFPFAGEEVFEQIRDIRRHGQDVILTLTIDPNVDDNHLISIAEKLSVFGRLQLRINHEATGTWFQFNRRCTYQEVADFYVRFHKIIKQHAPHIKTILCIGGIESAGAPQIVQEDEFTEAVRETDIWSVDKYLALHYAWPYGVAEPGEPGHYLDSVRGVYELTKASYRRFFELNGNRSKPMYMSELNSDGDVTGPFVQAKMLREFTDYIKNDPEQGWFSGFTMYQFRDRGRLGLEVQDPNNADIGLAQPILTEYRDIIRDEYFNPEIKIDGERELSLPTVLRWGGSEDASGVSLPITLEQSPTFFEITFDGDDAGANLMLELAGHWFYKSPETKTVDLIYAFFGDGAIAVDKARTINLNIFAPPATGENTLAAHDWRVNHYTTLHSVPDVRLRYQPTETMPTR